MKNKSTPTKIFFFLLMVFTGTETQAQGPNIAPSGVISECFIYGFGPNGSFNIENNCNELKLLIDGNPNSVVYLPSNLQNANYLMCGFKLSFDCPYDISEVEITGLTDFLDLIYFQVTGTDINNKTFSLYISGNQKISVYWPKIKTINYSYVYNTNGLFINNYFQLAGDLILRIPGPPKVKFAYDNSGNRTSRTIQLPTASSLKSAKVDSIDNEFKQMFEDKLDNTQITIYPNPTKGVLKIDITGFDNKSISVIYVYNTKGNMVTQKSPLSESNIIDLSPYSGGMYVLKIVLGNDVSEWKILKE